MPSAVMETIGPRLPEFLFNQSHIGFTLSYLLVSLGCVLGYTYKQHHRVGHYIMEMNWQVAVKVAVKTGYLKGALSRYGTDLR